MKTLLAISMVLILSACAEPITRHTEIIDGQQIEFRDADDGTMPCGGTYEAPIVHGCTQGQTIWISRVASEDEMAHEIAHATTPFAHGQWRADGCASVTVSGGRYTKGQRICFVNGNERVS